MPPLKDATKKPSNIGELIPPATPTAQQVPPIIPREQPGLGPASLGPAPSLWTTGYDSVRQWTRPGTSQGRFPPLPTKANPQLNAASRSVAKAVVAATPPVSTPSGGGGTDTDIITGVNRQGFGASDASYTKSDNNVSSLSITGITSGANEMAFTAAIGMRGGAGAAAGQSPGAGWTAAGVGYWNIIPAAGTQTIAQAFGSTALCAVQALLFLKTNGSTPVFTAHGSGSGGTSNVSFTFTPTAGNSILYMATTASANPTSDSYSIRDTAGNTYVQTHAFAHLLSGGFDNSAEVVFFYAQNVKAVSTTVTVTNVNGAGNWFFLEISNLSGLSSGSYTFQSSDLDKLVQFVGGANITATLPSPALAAGWQVLVSNNNTGTTTLTSAAGTFLNNGTAGVVLPPGGATWVFSDGTNYWTDFTSFAQNISKVSHKWLDSYDAITGQYTQSQPAASDLSDGVTGTPGVGSTVVLSNTPTISNPTLLGATIANATHFTNKIDKYNNIATVSNGAPSEYATVDNTTAVANIPATTLYAVPSSGIYRLSYYVIVNRVATTSSTLPDLQLTWTDPDNSTVQTFGPFDSATPSANTLTTMYSGTAVISAKAGTNIQYQTGVTTVYASVGATTMQYSVHLKVEAL